MTESQDHRPPWRVSDERVRILCEEEEKLHSPWLKHSPLLRDEVDLALDLRDARARIEELERKLAEAQQAFEELSKKQVEVHTWGLQVVDVLGQALEKIIDDGQPLISRIEIKTPDGRRFPVVWLWASVDPDGPVARIGTLAAHKQHAVAAARHWKAAAIEARLTVGVLLERLRQVEPGESVRYLAGTADAVALCAALAAEYIRRREQVALLYSALETCPHDSGCHPSEGIHTDACLQRKAALASVVHP